jgi:tyrosyl-tRNA synthetase
VGNFVSGVDLIRRILQKESFGLTTPLITLSSGAKMGKTEKGAVWLDKKMFSPYDYWQFWRNTDDDDVKKFLKYFTEININELSNKIEKEKDINKLKVLLANEATTILHGSKAAKDSQETAKTTFVQGGIGKNIPEKKISKSIISKGINIIELVFQNGLVSSKSEARRILKNRGIKINDYIIEDEKKILSLNDFSNNNFIKLSVGKKNHLKVTVI